MDIISKRILTYLDVISSKYNITIILAVESGSRAWNIASEDSDYDVRFIYIYNDYLKYIHEKSPCPKTITEFYEDRLIDMHGWNVDKAFHHLGQGNCSLFEWCFSPIIYYEHEKLSFRKFASEVFELEDYANFLCRSYRGQTIAHYKKFIKDQKIIPAKKYLYCIRPLVAFFYFLNCSARSTYVIDIHFSLEQIKDQFGEKFYSGVIQIIEEKKKIKQEYGKLLIDPEFLEDLSNIIESQVLPWKCTKNDLDIRKLSEKKFESLFLTLITPVTNSF